MRINRSALGAFFLLASLAFPHEALSQSQPGVGQYGSVTGGHVALWQANGFIKDGGAPAGSGTVTSAGASSDGILFSSTISGSPITTSGTFSFSPLSHAGNLAYITPNGSSGTPTFRALAGADLPTATTSTQGAVSVPLAGGLYLTGNQLGIAAPSTTQLGGVLSNGASATANNFVQYINNSGSPILAQPSFSNISGTAQTTQGGTGLTTFGTANQCLQVNSGATALVYGNCNGIVNNNVVIGTSLSNANPYITSDGSSGLYTAGTHLIGVDIAGSEITRFTGSGVTIGTSYIATAAPSNGLIVQGGVAIGTTSIGSSVVSIGATNFNDTAGTTGLQITGSINNYYQEILQNTNTGSSASADYIVGGNDMTATTHYADFGKNGSAGGLTPYANADATYLYTVDNELDFGSQNASGNITFGTGATPTTRMTIGTSGIGIGTTTSTYALDVVGTAGSTLAVNQAPVVTKVNVQTFTSTGTYTPSTGMVYATLECWGAGGGGGGISTGFSGGSGGGGAGGYSRVTVTAATVGASKAVTIATGGAGGTAGANNGSAGSGATSIGTLCVANAGQGGTAAATTAPGVGGAGGTAGTGDIAATGMAGGGGNGGAGGTTAVYALGGFGASTLIGGGGVAVTAASGGNNQVAGNAGTGKGSGGSGAASDNGGTAEAGGAGQGGECVVTEFISN